MPTKTGWLQLAGAFFSGALLVGAFAPLAWWWLSFPSLFSLALLQRAKSPQQGFWLGLAFGYGLYGVGVSWVYISLHIYGGMPLWMGGLAVLAFAGVLALFVALPCAMAAALAAKTANPNHREAQRLLALLLLWIIFEWAKSWVLTGFPWLDVGYSQTNSWLFSLAPIGGVYLVSFAVVTCAFLAAFAVASNTPQRARLIAVLGVLVIPLISVCVTKIHWSQADGPPLTVGIVQPNTPVNKKWQPRYRDKVIQNLANLSVGLQRDLNARGAEFAAGLDLIVWPETALPLAYQQTGNEFWASLTTPKTALLTGIMDSPGFEQSYNAAVLSCAGEQQIYRKRHLVPFGEYLPLRFLFAWVLDYLNLPMSDFSAWKDSQSLQCGEHIKVGLSICYEDAFAAEFAKHSGDATLLVNISEDAWFGDSLAPHQRLQMAQMRARELSRPMVRSANSGPSAVIDQYGQVLADTGQFETATLLYKLQPQSGATPFKRFGNWIVWLCLLGFVVLLVGQLTQRRTS